MSLFWYKRKVKEKKNFKEEIEGKERVVEREVEVVYWDCLNTDFIVRGLWFGDKVFAVLLNDGHEQATERQIPVKNKNNGTKLETQRIRDWHYSQIELDREDAERLWRGRMFPSVKEEEVESVEETEEQVAVD